MACSYHERRVCDLVFCEQRLPLEAGIDQLNCVPPAAVVGDLSYLRYRLVLRSDSRRWRRRKISSLTVKMLCSFLSEVSHLRCVSETCLDQLRGETRTGPPAFWTGAFSERGHSLNSSANCAAARTSWRGW